MERSAPVGGMGQEVESEGGVSLDFGGIISTLGSSCHGAVVNKSD